jgi:hypothetical protein
MERAASLCAQIEVCLSDLRLVDIVGTYTLTREANQPQFRLAKLVGHNMAMNFVAIRATATYVVQVSQQLLNTRSQIEKIRASPRQSPLLSDGAWQESCRTRLHTHVLCPQRQDVGFLNPSTHSTKQSKVCQC